MWCGLGLTHRFRSGPLGLYTNGQLSPVGFGLGAVELDGHDADRLTIGYGPNVGQTRAWGGFWMTLRILTRVATPAQLQHWPEASSSMVRP